MRPGRALVSLVGAGILAAAPAAGRASAIDEGSERGADDVAQVLLDARSAGVSMDALVEALARCGSAALPHLFEALGRGRFDVRVGERGNSTKAVEPGEREALVASFGRLPLPEVRLFLDERLAENPPEPLRGAALEVLGAHGSGSDLRSLLDWCEPEDAGARVPRPLRDRFAAAFAGILERDPEALGHVPALYEGAHLSLVPSIVSAVGAIRSAESLAALVDLLAGVPAADALVLAEIGHLGRVVRHPIDPHARGGVRAYLSWRDPTILAEAIVAAGCVEDVDALPQLVLLLEHEEPNVGARALDALVAITNERLGPDASAWEEWLARVAERRRTQIPEQLRQVADGPPAMASRALLELAGLRVQRHELAEPLCAGLEREEPDLVVMTCAALGALGSSLAVPPLLELLENPGVEIRRAAFLALRRITAEDHGELSRDWHAAGW